MSERPVFRDFMKRGFPLFVYAPCRMLIRGVARPQSTEFKVLVRGNQMGVEVKKGYGIGVKKALLL